MQTQQGLKIFGGGILSSKQETCYSLESDIPKRQPLQVIKLDLVTLLNEARTLGMKPSAYAPQEDAT